MKKIKIATNHGWITDASHKEVVHEIILPVLSGSTVIFKVTYQGGCMDGWFQLTQQQHRMFMWGYPTIELASPFGLMEVYPMNEVDTLLEMMPKNNFSDASEVTIYYVNSSDASDSIIDILNQMSQDILCASESTFVLSEDREELDGVIKFKDLSEITIKIDRSGNTEIDGIGHFDGFFNESSETISQFWKLFTIIAEKFPQKSNEI